MWTELEKNRKKYLSLNLQDILDYEKFSMISIIYHSTKIEGCSLSETDTQILLDKDITAKGKPLKDHLMIKDHYNAFLFIKEQAIQKRRFSIEFLQEVCSILMRNTGQIVHTASGTFDTSKGDLRLAQVYVDKKYFPDFHKVPSLLEQLVLGINSRMDKAKTEEDILKLSADFHYNLVNIHPFGDGNGRLSRLFMNYILLYFNQPLVKIFTEDRAEYIDSLNDTEEKENLSIFRDFISMQQNKFFLLEIEKYKKSGFGFNLMI